MQNKWLDNFGKADNANDSKVSMSEDFVGLGYDTKGRNYSPAWGGQFEQGGIIPSAQNGVSKYMKKKIKEKQDESIAAQYDLPEVVVQGFKDASPWEQAGRMPQYTPSPTFPYLEKTKDPAEFFKSWITSPEYRRRKIETDYPEYAEYSPVTGDEIDDPYKGPLIDRAMRNNFLKLEQIQRPGAITYDPTRRSEYFVEGEANVNPKDFAGDINTVKSHEIAHAIDTNIDDLSNRERELLTSATEGWLNKRVPRTLSPELYQKVQLAQHLEKPTELKADLNALRFLMYDKDIYDIRKGEKFTKEHLEKAKEKLKGNQSLDRTLMVTGDDNLINLMNIIAKKDEELTPIAMNGTSMPGSVGFTYARVAGAAPSKGKYAKKTMASAQNGIIADKIAGLELQQNPEYQRLKYLQSLPQLRQSPGLLEKILGPADSDLVKAADIATDIMQLGNFIPHPIAQGIGKIGNVAGTALDSYQAAASFYKGDNVGGVVNAASAVLPSFLGASTFRRPAMNLRPGDPLYSLTEQATKPYALNLAKPSTDYLELFSKVKKMKDNSLLYNRALLGFLGGEMAYDALAQPSSPNVINSSDIEGVYPNFNIELENPKSQPLPTKTESSDPAIAKKLADYMKSKSKEKTGEVYGRKSYYPIDGFENGGEIPSAQNGIMSPMLLARNVLNYFYPSEEATSTVGAAPVEYKKGLTDELLKRQAYKESTFNPAAVSPAGYKGLTQIGEEVLIDYSKKKGGKKLDPFNPKDAVELQKFAMDDLYNASFINKPDQPDSVRLAKTLAAYNWGRGNLFNYLNEQKQKGVDIYDSYDWLNDLPKETSDYVNKILLQEDQSFNKNYKRDSTNPKYKDVTSLYDKKRFGGKVTTAQNGQEMRFYQNGLDWKPKSMQDGGKIYEGQELPEFVVEGKDERIKEAMSQGINKFYGHVGELMGAPQKEMMQLITGKEQTPSQAFGFQDTGGWLDSYSSFGKNLSNFAMDSVLDPVNLIGVGIADDIARTTLKGASKKLASSADDVSKSFKSEIDWGKWNPDTPKYPELIKEYNKIEEATKKAGTWMQNPDGSVFKGTPEQFIQQQSSYFKKAYPQGYNEVYRGVSTNTSFPNFNESADPGLRGPRGIFTANKELASNYIYGPQGWQEEKRILTPFDPDNTPGLFELIYPKGKQITRYQNLDDWTNIDLARTPTKENIKYNIDNMKSQLERRKKITEELSSTEGMSSIADHAKIEIKSQEDRIKQLQKYYDDFDSIINDEAEFNKMKNALGEQTTTDTIAKYIPNTKLRSVTLQDLIDSGQGDVTIVNNRPGNYLKSMVGNVGFFDLKNPNVYKGIVPAGIATSLTFDEQKNGGITKDNQGYWNPDNWGKPVEIDSNDITMEGVNQPLLGVSDTGDTKLMKPGKNYKFKGKKVTEFPVAKLGINQLDAQPMKKLNQLLNFTNNPDKDNWLDKYN